MDQIGPVDYAIVMFPGNDFRGEIEPALAELVAAARIRILDITFVIKDGDGTVVSLELTDLDPTVAAGLRNVGYDTSGLFSEADLQAAAEELEPGSSAVLIVWENLWALKAAQAFRDAGGVVVDFDRLPHDAVQAAREWAASNA